MSFGKMNKFINIIETQQIKDAEGFASFTDKVLASVRAYREERHGNVAWANRAAFSTATTLFRFRVIPNFSPVSSYYIGLYIVCEGERFKIISTEDVRGRGMYIEVLTERVKAVKG